VANRKVLVDFAASLIGADAKRALELVAEVSAEGIDVSHVLRDLLAHLRNLVATKVAPQATGAPAVIDLPDEELRELTGQAQTAELDDLTRLYHGLSKNYDDVVRAISPRASFEMLLIRLARRPQLLPLDELLSRVGELEKRLSRPGPGPSGGSASGSASGAAGAGAAPGRPTTRGAQGQATALQGSALQGSPQQGSAQGGARATRTTDAAFDAFPFPGARPQPQAEARPQPRSMGSSRPSSLATAERPEVFAMPPLHLVATPREEPAPESAPAQSKGLSLVDPGPVPTETELHLELRNVLARFRNEKPGLASIFEHAIPIEVNKEHLVLGFAPNSFLGTQATEPEAILTLTQAAKDHFGEETKVMMDVSAQKDGRATISEIEAARRARHQFEVQRALANHPLVLATQEIFGAEIRELRAADDSPRSKA
jgi:DNA polymerase III subunit gamma/tau